MSKLTLAIALYAAVAASIGLVVALPGDPESPGGEPAENGVSAVAAREVITRARQEAREEIQPAIRELEAWKGRIDTIRTEMQEELKDLDQWIEETTQLSAGGLDDLKERLKSFAGIGPRLDALAKEIKVLAARVKEVEERPAVIREVATGPSKPDKPVKPDGPAVPTLPEAPTEDPNEIARKVEQAMSDLQSDSAAKIWAAINTVRKYEVLDAAPRLIGILEGHKNPMLQQAAAQALGAIRACDAVPALAEALVASDDSLGQVANRALREITGFDTAMAEDARIKARRRARTAVIAWWRSNEEAVRARLGQPKG